MNIGMSHNRLPCLVLALSCLASTHAFALAEETTYDKLLFNCSFKPRGATIASDGTYQRAYVSAATNGASNNTDDLRLYQGATARQRFSMIWKSYNSTNGNQWYITPDYAGKCMSVNNGYVHATTCDDNKTAYLTVNDGYYVISFNSDFSESWKVPSDPNGTGYIARATFSPNDSLATRQRFHWEIRDCTNTLGNAVSPAP